MITLGMRMVMLVLYYGTRSAVDVSSKQLELVLCVYY